MHAVSWGEGADFEMKELIHESLNKEEWAALKEYYPEYFVAVDTDDEDESDKSNSDEFYEKVQEDITDLLDSLIQQEDKT